MKGIRLTKAAIVAWKISAAGLLAADYVVLITVDGLRPDTIEQLGPTEVPSFHRLQNEGVWTHNARTDFDWTWTVPNHTTMMTARPVEGANGHNYTFNGNPDANATFHLNKGSYVTSIFDVAHDNGKTTGVFVGKSKLVIFDQSYNATAGAPDLVPPDYGPDKIDFYVHNGDATADELTGVYLSTMASSPMNFTWLHLRDPDAQGHGFRWETANYSNAVKDVDGYVGEVLNFITTNAVFSGKTTVILTSDHGGIGQFHEDETRYENYRIPFYVWGADVPVSGDLYSINWDTRAEPGLVRPPYAEALQPIRNGDVGNLALMLFGLPSVPDAGAIINRAQDLRLAQPYVGGNPSADFVLDTSTSARGIEVQWPNFSPAFRYVVQVRDALDAPWQNAPGVWPSHRPYWVMPFDAERQYLRVLGAD